MTARTQVRLTFTLQRGNREQLEKLVGEFGDRLTNGIDGWYVEFDDARKAGEAAARVQNWQMGIGVHVDSE